LSVALVKPTAIAKHEGIEQVEADLLNMPQVEPNIIHRFGPGIYIREMSVPAGTMFIGHAHKYPHTNILLAGSVVVQINGDMQTIHAPSIFVAAPGRKLAYVIDDCVWQNIYATEETDIEKLEVMLVDKSETFTAHSSASADYKSQMVAADREDYPHCYPGLYVRELTMPAGLIVVSRIHLREHPFYILSGEVSVYDGNGVSTYVGPYKGITKPGTKRVLYTHKDTVWVTFHATDKTTVEDLEKAGELVCDKFDEFDVIVNSEVS
jgi:quercetin dioxygenase-like cupin family protein